ncbi:flagellin [Clostridioides mangenotii]|uniref:flagellin N-terminal helical domain-containing protein n=1 Tax=Metaclostridioides mangenotii TaxID=1540 RepID=UPI001C1281E6|nr:flagellin [Clostridioides mangenotii]MBU5306431.1 flagellin [Clostridioides mangenotii]MCR1953459.1 flagellin [Clostridioides mangenotii]
MRINNNVNALIANNQMNKNTALQSRSMEKLSSGLRIKRAADDSAGLAISEKMRNQIKGLNQAGLNVQDGISVVQTAEGALEETGNILKRMSQLSVQSANETNTKDEREKIANELTQLNDELTRMSKTTEFNGKQLLDGSNTQLSLQVGSDGSSNNQINVDLVNTSKIMTDAGITSANISSMKAGTSDGTTAARTMMSNIDAALAKVNSARSTLGAQQNRLESTSANLSNTVENITAAESRIRDTDVASEMVQLSKLNILAQASQSMLAQANQQPQSILQLMQ